MSESAAWVREGCVLRLNCCCAGCCTELLQLGHLTATHPSTRRRTISWFKCWDFASCRSVASLVLITSTYIAVLAMFFCTKNVIKISEISRSELRRVNLAILNVKRSTLCLTSFFLHLWWQGISHGQSAHKMLNSLLAGTCDHDLYSGWEFGTLSHM